MRRWRALLVLLVLDVPCRLADAAGAEDASTPLSNTEEAPPQASDGGVPQRNVPAIETERVHVLPYTPVKPVRDACSSSIECAEKLGYGEVCVDGACEEYEDKEDLFTLLHMTQSGRAVPKPFELLPAILPVV